MSQAPFPERIDPFRKFAREETFNGDIPIEKFQRFKACLSDSNAPVEAYLAFGHDDYERRLISGTLRVRVAMQCQRCLRDMPVAIDTELAVRVLASDAEARAMPEDMEAVLVDDGGVDLLSLVEDELILSLPSVPQHEDPGCNTLLNQLNAETDPDEGGGAFDKLKELKLGKPDG